MPEFDDPFSAEWQQLEGGPAGTDDDEFTTTVTADGQDFGVSCAVSGTENNSTLTATS